MQCQMNVKVFVARLLIQVVVKKLQPNYYYYCNYFSYLVLNLLQAEMASHYRVSKK